MFRNADSRKRRVSVSNESSRVSVKTSESGMKLMVVPVPSPFLSLRSFVRSPCGNPRS